MSYYGLNTEKLMQQTDLEGGSTFEVCFVTKSCMKRQKPCRISILGTILETKPLPWQQDIEANIVIRL